MSWKVRDRVVATSRAEHAPENRMTIVQLCEFDREFATTRLRLELPFGITVELFDTTQLEVLEALLQQAIPEVRRLEGGLERDWKQWRESLGDAESSDDIIPA